VLVIITNEPLKNVQVYTPKDLTKENLTGRSTKARGVNV